MTALSVSTVIPGWSITAAIMGLMRLTAALALGKGLVEPVGHASQDRGALHQGHGNPGVGDIQGGPEARRAAADHQGGPGQRHLALGQGDRVPHLGQPHADQLQGLHQRGFRFPGVHPGAVFPEVDDFQEIGVDAVFGQQTPKGGLVELGEQAATTIRFNPNCLISLAISRWPASEHE